MVRYVNLGDLSNYRTELMGFSALLILICHSTAYIDMPSIVVYAFSVANIGVDLFLFFSGMGMWYSLQRWCDVSHKGNNRNVCWGGVMRWYLNRYRQLLVPYLLTLVPIVICQAAMGNAPAHGIVDYVLYITSFRFYVSHDAPWFIAAIIPLYLLAPLFFSLIKKYAWQASDLIIVVMWSILLIKPTSDTEVFNNILQNIQFVSVRATSFVLGISWGGIRSTEKACASIFVSPFGLFGRFACPLVQTVGLWLFILFITCTLYYDLYFG